MKVLILLTLFSQCILAGQEEVQTAITKGVDFLVQHQNKNGSWGSPHRTKQLNIFAPLPDGHQAYRSASSALALHGLLESKDRRPATVAAINKGEKWLLSVLPLQRSINRTATYNIWSHAYGLRALSSLYREYEDTEKRAEYIRQAKLQIKKLSAHEDVNRGWGYYDFDHKTVKPTGSIMSFTTATAILAMIDTSKTMGIELPPGLKERTLSALQQMRTPDLHVMLHHARWVIPLSLMKFFALGSSAYLTETAGLISAENVQFPTRPQLQSLATSISTDTITQQNASLFFQKMNAGHGKKNWRL